MDIVLLKCHPHTDDGHCKIVEMFVLKKIMTSENTILVESIMSSISAIAAMY